MRSSDLQTIAAMCDDGLVVALVVALIVAPLSLTVDRIYRAFGFSEAEQAELLASPEHRAYEAARLEAAEQERAFQVYLGQRAAEIAADLLARCSASG